MCPREVPAGGKWEARLVRGAWRELRHSGWGQDAAWNQAKGPERPPCRSSGRREAGRLEGNGTEPRQACVFFAFGMPSGGHLSGGLHLTAFCTWGTGGSSRVGGVRTWCSCCCSLSTASSPDPQACCPTVPGSGRRPGLQ